MEPLGEKSKMGLLAPGVTVSNFNIDDSAKAGDEGLAGDLTRRAGKWRHN